MSNFYRALNESENHKTNTDEIQQHKNRVINKDVELYNNYFNSYKKFFNETTLDEMKTYDSY